MRLEYWQSPLETFGSDWIILIACVASFLAIIVYFMVLYYGQFLYDKDYRNEKTSPQAYQRGAQSEERKALPRQEAEEFSHHRIAREGVLERLEKMLKG